MAAVAAAGLNLVKALTTGMPAVPSNPPLAAAPTAGAAASALTGPP
ncbi:hypothetical protein AB0H83_48645 [Dactylosporangium sp. NPDC050688]